MMIYKPMVLLRPRGPYISCALIGVILLSYGGIASAQNSGPSQVIPLSSGMYQQDRIEENVALLATELQFARTETGATRSSETASSIAKPQVSIARDPLARWIFSALDPVSTDGSVEVSVPFTLNAGAVVQADLEFIAGFDGELVPGTAGQLRLNGHVIGEVWHALAEDLDASIMTGDIAPVLHSGVNWLSINGTPVDPSTRIIFSARVNVWRPTSEFVPPAEVIMDPANSTGAPSSASAATGLACFGYTCRPRGDLDSNYDVDELDHAIFAECMSGVNSVTENCEYADLDCDGDVDLADAAAFQLAFTGNP